MRRSCGCTRITSTNARFDWQKLQPIWSPAPEAVFFNLNGHTYQGREHWTNLWKFSTHRTCSRAIGRSYDIGGVVGDDLAVVWCHRKTRRQWTGTEPPPRDINYDLSAFVTRSTMVFRKEDGQRRVVHAHFSKADDGPRPGGVDVAAATEHPAARRHDGAAMRGHGDACRRDGPRGHMVCRNPFNRGILPAAAACAVATRRLRIGAGVFNPFNRHPTLMAIEIAPRPACAGARPVRDRAGAIGAVEDGFPATTARSARCARRSSSCARCCAARR